MTFNGEHDNHQPAPPPCQWNSPSRPPPTRPDQFQQLYPGVIGYQQPPPPPPNACPGFQRRPSPGIQIHTYHPRVGFARLSARFQIWNTMTSGESSCLNPGPQLFGPIAYSAKMFSSSRLKVKDGPYQSAVDPVCTIESRNTFSRKTTISFQGPQSQLKDASEFHEGAAWPFDVDVNGAMQKWQWTRMKSNSSIRTFFNVVSDRDIGNWALLLRGGNGQPAATFSPEGGNTFEDGAALGIFSFHGPVANGELGDIFMNVSVAVFLRILSQQYISRIASLAS